MNQLLDINPIVLTALKLNQPVVALESTIISHGMPFPRNVEMALEVEKIIKNLGAIPATIAIMNGKIKIGLTEAEINDLAQAKNVIKVSKRDLGYVLSQQKIGATTVSATMIASSLAGIKVFATGGIGGVHRNAQETFDISRDLEELAELNVCVVCAGAKSILDLGLTLEYLETKGVEVLGYQTSVLPAFYTNQSDFKVDYNISTPKEIAEIMNTKWRLPLKGGILVTNPIPEAHSMDRKLIDGAIDHAVKKAEQMNIKGKDTTPFLLATIKDITQGSSLSSNLALVYNNAKLAAQIAIEFSLLQAK